jgi:hypothetical protein
MTKAKKILLTTAIVTAVGITYAISTFKDLPDVFDWEGEFDET